MNSKLPIILNSIGICSLGGYAIYYLWNRLKNKNKIRPPCKDIFELMKKTPMVYIKSLSELTGRNIYAKCEHHLPFTSKDRMIKNILMTAQKQGILHKDSVIYEGSSGSTAYSVAAISKLLGYKCKIIIPDDCSKEKVQLLKTTGCEIIITKQCPFSNFKDNYNRKAKKMAEDDPNGFYVNQFFNTINMETHYKETGPEIYEQLNEKVDAFVCSAGTGGTISGISKYLKEKNNNCKVILGDIAGSGMASYVKEGVMFTKEESEAMRKKERYYSVLEGIGINYLTDNFKEAKIDDAYKISDDEALFISKYVYEHDGIFVGGSAAVNFCAIIKMCKDNLVEKGANVATIIFDSGIKYMSKFSGDNEEPNSITDISQI